MEPADDLRSSRFRRQREADWRALEELLGETDRGGTRSLSFEQARRLATLYRQACTSLSVAREISLDRALLTYLEALVARAYLSVYAPQDRLGNLIGRFFVYGAPGAARRSVFHILAGLLLLGLGSVAAYLLYGHDPSWYDALMPADLSGGRDTLSDTEELLAVIYGDASPPADQLAAFASYLFSHNTQVAFFSFALGVVAGLPTALLGLYNGLILGALVALHVERGIGWDLFGWLSIHGVTELSALAVAAGGGFRLAQGLLFPGGLSRAASLRAHGRDAAKLAILAAVMLLVAGLVEGFLRQLITDTSTRLTIGWGLGILWLAWLGLSGRPGRETERGAGR